MRFSRVLGVLAVSASLLLAACGDNGASPTASSGSSGAAPASVRLQLQWTDQAQFAGYYAAEQQGYYADENLTVEMLPGGGDVVPQQVGFRCGWP